MKEIVSVPSSVRYYLERARQYAENGEPSAANAMLRVAGEELARQQPEFCALLIAGAMGHRGIEFTETEYGRVPMSENMRMFSLLRGDGPDSDLRPVRKVTKSLRLL